MKKELKVPRIKNGTVIDHITAGNAVKVLHILGIPKTTSSTVSVAMNVKSKLGKKDIVKVENRELDPKEVDKIALIAPKATINIIRNYEVFIRFSRSSYNCLARSSVVCLSCTNLYPLYDILFLSSSLSI